MSVLSPDGSDLAVVIPAFNEGDAIDGVITGLRNQLPNCEIIVIDDGSTDQTSTHAARHECTVVRHRSNRGYGASWKSGTHRVSRPYIAFFDGDGQMQPEDLVKAFIHCRTHGCDMVSGCRDTASHAPIIRRPGKWVLHRLANYLSKRSIPDPNCGMRVFRTEILKRYLPLLPDGYSASLTSLLLMIRRGYEVGFIEISTRRRIGQSSASQVRDGSSTLITLIRTMALFDPLRIFLPPAIFLVVVGSGYSLNEAIMQRLGFPVLGALMVLTGLICFLLGVICDQISLMRIERFESPTRDESLTSSQSLENVGPLNRDEGAV